MKLFDVFKKKKPVKIKVEPKKVKRPKAKVKKTRREDA